MAARCIGPSRYLRSHVRPAPAQLGPFRTAGGHPARGKRDSWGCLDTDREEPIMPIQEVGGTGLSYRLIAFDDHGRERIDDPDGLMSQNTAATLTERPVTDVFIFSHGWMADIPAARRQYGKWVTAMAASKGDIDQ